MVEFYAAQARQLDPAYTASRVELVRWTETYTAKYATLLCVEAHTQLLLCIDHRESEFDKNLMDPVGGSYGVGQVLKKYNAGLRKFYLKAHGIRLGKDSNLETQVAYSVAMFKFKLDLNKGNAYEAVRAYNGAGQGARRYRKKVIASLRKIYGIDLKPTGKYTPWRPNGKR